MTLQAAESQGEQSLPPSEMSTNGEAVLERMGLNGGAIRNVMMHRDLVPRAFSCDYTLVADLLALVSDSFRNLESLQGPHRRVSTPHSAAASVAYSLLWTYECLARWGCPITGEDSCVH